MTRQEIIDALFANMQDEAAPTLQLWLKHGGAVAGLVVGVTHYGLASEIEQGEEKSFCEVALPYELQWVDGSAVKVKVPLAAIERIEIPGKPCNCKVGHVYVDGEYCGCVKCGWIRW